MNQTLRKRYKVVLLGDPSVGKSSIMIRLQSGEFYEYLEPTIGGSYCSYSYITDLDKEVKFDIWDTSGSERYRSLVPLYYRDANIGIIVYSIDNPESKNNSLKWLEKLVTKVPDSKLRLIMLVKNKIDRLDNENNNENDKYNHIKSKILKGTLIKLFEINTSAKTGIGIKELFNKIGKEMESEELIEYENSIKLEIDKEYESSSLNMQRIRKCCF